MYSQKIFEQIGEENCYVPAVYGGKMGLAVNNSRAVLKV
jgi:hypothetical protein